MIGNPIQSKLQLVERTIINHDCILAKFKFVGPVIPLNIGNHLLFSYLLIKLEWSLRHKIIHKEKYLRGNIHQYH